MTTNRARHHVRGSSMGLLRFVAFVFLLLQLAVPLATVQTAYAAGGAYSINFSAADPDPSKGPFAPTYTKVSPSQIACPTPSGSGGRASDPMANAIFGNPKDSVESLAPPSMALGQIVPFEVRISVSGSTAPENGVILFTPYWLTKTASGGDFGYDPAYEVYCAFVDTADAASVDPGANAKVDSWTDTVVNTGTSNEQIQGTIQVSGLDNGDSVIVEIWVVLKKTIPAGTSGNVQSGLVSARTANGETINVGNKTVPLLQVGSFFSANADVSITKSDSPDPVNLGGQLTYSLVVTNNSTTTIANGVVVTDTLDANTSFVSGSWSGGTCSAASGVVTCNLGSLAQGQSVTITIVVNVSASAPTETTTGIDPVGACTAGSADLCNLASVTAITSDPTPANNSASQGTNVLGAPALTLDKTASRATYSKVGDVISYSYKLTNSGNVTLSGPFTVTDDKATVTCPTDMSLAPGAFITCTASYTITQADLDADSVTNVAKGHGFFGTTPVDSNQDSETVTAVAGASIDVEKYVSVDGGATWEDADAAPCPYLAAGVNPQFKFVVTNTGNVTLSNISLTDSDFDLSGCTIPATLAPAATFECLFTADWAAGQHTDTATASVNYGGKAYSDTDDANYFGAAPAIEIQKTPDSQTVVYAEAAGFTILVKNIGNVPLTGVVVSDPLAPTCDASIGDLAVGAVHEYTCSVENVTMDFTNVATATGYYGTTPVTDTDDAAVDVDFLPEVLLTKDVSPETLPEPGGVFTYTLTIKNLSVESVTITDLTDSNMNPLPAECAALIGETLPIGGELSCSYTMTWTEAGAYPNTASVTVDDGEGHQATDSDDAMATVTDVMPTVDLTKTAFPTSLPEPGGVFEFTLSITNTSVEAVKITALTDTNALSPECLALVGTTIPAGGTVSCTYSVTHTEAGDYPNTASVTVEDNEGNLASDSDTETVTVENALPDISITKTADPTSVPETGGTVTFTFVVTNDGVEDVTLTSLTDSVFGDLNGQGNCETGGVIPAGGSYTCAITKWLAGDDLVAHYNVTTVVGTDNEGTTDTATDDETVTFDDVAPQIQITKSASPSTVPEMGGNVTFTFLVENIGPEDVTLTAVSDTMFGDLDGKGTCDVPVTIPVGGSYSCEYVVFLSSDSLTAHYNVVTATAVDDDNTPATDDDDETVIFDDVAPEIRITKTANPTIVPETGGWVTFTFLVENIGVEDVSLTTLTDTMFGDLTAYTGSTCVLPQAIAISGSYSCQITAWLAADNLADHTNVATATAVDDDGTPATDTDDETVTFSDVAPAIRVTKTADPTHVPETGGDVTFTFLVENIGQEDVTLTSLTDTVFGDINGQGDCVLPQTILIGGSYSCSITEFLSSDSLTDHYNVTTATAVDDENTPATDDDDETVEFDDVAPVIDVTKTASPTSVPETGGSVTFTFRITNVGEEEVTVTSILDNEFGDLLALAESQNDNAAIVLAPDAWYEFTYTTTLSSDTLAAHTNRVDVIAVDDDNTTATDYDDETVTFDNVMPDIMVTKTANPTSVLETGGWVEFTYVVMNLGLEDVTITSLYDDVYGILAGDADCQVGTVLPGSAQSMQLMAIIPVGSSCAFTITKWVEGDFSGPDHVNWFTAVGADNDGNSDTATDDATVDFENVMPSIMVEKTANPTAVPETGGSVIFTYKVTNTSTEEPVTITSLEDSLYGILAGDADCAVGTVLAAGASCDFTLTKWVSGNYSGPDHVNVFTAVAEDNDGTTATDDDDATVEFENVLPFIDVTKTANPTSVPETGGDVTFTFLVKNNSAEWVIIMSLTDSVFGALTGDDDCKVGATLAPDATCEFSLTEWVEGDYSGPAHANVFTAVSQDNDGTEATDNDAATVTFTDVLPAIEVTKTANPTSVPETGGNVTFTYVVTNTSSEEPVTITSLFDDVFGTLAGEDDCKVGTALAAGESCEFAITQWVAGDYPGSHVNVFTAKAVDNDNTEAMDDDNATVDFTDVLPDISIVKTANPTSVPETGGDVTFTFVVKNNSAEAVSLTSLSDNVFGDLNGQGTCDVPQTLAGNGGAYTCMIAKWIAGDFEGGVSHTNTAIVVASDDDGNSDTASDDATVDFTDIDPKIDVEKYVSVDGGATWVDADAATGPTLVKGTDPQFKFVVKNTGPVALSNISLTDSDFDLSGCSKTDPLAAGASFECVITAPWVMGQHVDTATASGDFSDGAGITETATDTDAANYYGYEQTGVMLPTQTTCQMYRDGMWPPMYDAFLYQVKGGKINSLNPGVIFYYNTITAPSASFTLTVGETNSMGWKPMKVQDLGQAILYTADCSKAGGVKVSASGTNPYTVTFTVTGATPGATYYIGIKYSPDNLVGQSVGKAPYPTSIYSFGTKIDGAAQLGSETSIPVAPKK